jgi:hypothetical protein
MLEKARSPDGSVVFPFTPDAAAFVEAWREGREKTEP